MRRIDVAQGGPDKTVLAAGFGHWYALRWSPSYGRRRSGRGRIGKRGRGRLSVDEENALVLEFQRATQRAAAAAVITPAVRPAAA